MKSPRAPGRQAEPHPESRSTAMMKRTKRTCLWKSSPPTLTVFLNF
ncbi:hypothetical protein E2C01_093803 [Portunus trituberculatus]|uniref:Uncharacterized protein n=1 Tax=Portunus trituberculatus TaxID=210409 RepID=A0A5B7JQS6_PORTR|nr:hypothetical protein [Portunus trituberculatus]